MYDFHSEEIAEDSERERDTYRERYEESQSSMWILAEDNL